MAAMGDELERRYVEWASTSAKLAEEARRYLPGGDTRASAHYKPFPVFMRGGHGCRLEDVDGREFVDFMNNFTSLVHGHAHPPTVRAVSGSDGACGSAHAAPTEESGRAGAPALRTRALGRRAAFL